MNTNQFCADILRTYNRLHDIPSTIELSNRQITYWLDSRRAKYIENAQNKMLLNDQMFQELRDSTGSVCIELCQIDKAECDAICYGEKALKVKIPQLIYYPDMESLRVNLVDKISRIYYTNPELLFSRLSTSMGRNFNWSTIIDGWLYVIPSYKQWDNFSVVNIRGLWTEPTKITGFDFYNDQYPCPAGIMNDIKIDILTKELRISMAMLADETNNQRDNHVASVR